jgi:hypothetical protein
MVNQIEWIRKQIYDLQDKIKENKKVGDVAKAGKDLDDKLMAVEENLIQLKLTGGSQDILRWPMKLYGKISMLAGSIMSGDFPPTDQAFEVHALYKEQISAYQGQIKELVEKDVATFNKILEENKLEGIVTEIK